MHEGTTGFLILKILNKKILPSIKRIKEREDPEIVLFST